MSALKPFFGLHALYLLWRRERRALAAFPIFMFGGRSYGTLGTLLVGQWAFATVAALFLLVAASPEERALS